MILFLGATGYIGQAFTNELRRRGHSFIPLTREAFDYTSFDFLFDYVRKMKPEFVINAAGYVGGPVEESCELDHVETLSANTFLPQTVSRVCLMTNTPWAHVSSGNIYSGAKVVMNGEQRIERNLARTEIRQFYAQHPENFLGFNEWDEPNFSFRSAPCTFYSGSKALAEEVIRNNERTYIWRPALPFNEMDCPRNFISKILRRSRVQDSVHSLSHLDDFVQACLNLWERRASFGIYNIANPGVVTMGEIVTMMQRILNLDGGVEFGDERREPFVTKEPHASYILDVSKLLATGVKLRPVHAALEDSLRKWRATRPAFEMSGIGVN